jgi:hypothetical protein
MRILCGKKMKEKTALVTSQNLLIINQQKSSGQRRFISLFVLDAKSPNMILFAYNEERLPLYE